MGVTKSVVREYASRSITIKSLSLIVKRQVYYWLTVLLKTQHFVIG